MGGMANLLIENKDLIESSTNLFSILSLSFALPLAAITYFMSKRAESASKAMDLMGRMTTDDAFLQARTAFSDIKKAFPDASEIDGKIDTLSRRKLMIFLNQMELISLQIRTRTLGERAMKIWFNSAILSDFEYLHPYILETRLRMNNSSLMSNWEWLYARWK